MDFDEIFWTCWMCDWQQTIRFCDDLNLDAHPEIYKGLFAIAGWGNCTSVQILPTTHKVVYKFLQKIFAERCLTSNKPFNFGANLDPEIFNGHASLKSIVTVSNFTLAYFPSSTLHRSRHVTSRISVLRMSQYHISCFTKTVLCISSFSIFSCFSPSSFLPAAFYIPHQ